MRRLCRWTALTVAVLAGLITAASLTYDEPMTTDDVIGTAIYAAVCVAGLYVFWRCRPPKNKPRGG